MTDATRSERKIRKPRQPVPMLFVECNGTLTGYRYLRGRLMRWVAYSDGTLGYKGVASFESFEDVETFCAINAKAWNVWRCAI